VSAIQLAVENGGTSLAFPAISTGIYGYPLECWAEAQRTGVRIKLVAFDGKTGDCLRRHLSARMEEQSSK
jgi:Macro domain